MWHKQIEFAKKKKNISLFKYLKFKRTLNLAKPRKREKARFEVENRSRCLPCITIKRVAHNRKRRPLD